MREEWLETTKPRKVGSTCRKLIDGLLTSVWRLFDFDIQRHPDSNLAPFCVAYDLYSLMFRTLLCSPAPNKLK
jgi:hypothetical protein